MIISPGHSGRLNGIFYSKRLGWRLAHSWDIRMLVVIIIISPSWLSLRTVSFLMPFLVLGLEGFFLPLKSQSAQVSTS